MSQVKKAFSKSVKFSKIPITLAKKGLPDQILLNVTNTSLPTAGSTEESEKSSSFETDHLETESNATDPDSIFGTSRLTPRTPPPKSILKSEREWFEILILELNELLKHFLFLAQSSLTLFHQINLMMSKSIKS